MSDEDLVRRLRAYEEYGEYDLLTESRPERLRNPDGPDAADAIKRLTRERDAARVDAEEWQDKYDAEHKEADEISIKLDGARKDWGLQSKISNGYAEALIATEKERDEALNKLQLEVRMTAALIREREDAHARAEAAEDNARLMNEAASRYLRRAEQAERGLGEARGEALRWENGCNAALDRAEAAERKVEKLREALALAEVVYRKNCIVSGEPSSVLYAMQSTLKETE